MRRICIICAVAVLLLALVSCNDGHSNGSVTTLPALVTTEQTTTEETTLPETTFEETTPEETTPTVTEPDFSNEPEDGGTKRY